MDNVKDNKYYLNKILDEISIIESYLINLTLEQLEEEPIIIDAGTFRLIQISEHISHLTPDFCERHNHIKWNLIKGVRNKIVHDYGIVDNRIIATSLYNDLPVLKIQIQEILDK